MYKERLVFPDKVPKQPVGVRRRFARPCTLNSTRYTTRFAAIPVEYPPTLNQPMSQTHELLSVEQHLAGQLMYLHELLLAGKEGKGAGASGCVGAAGPTVAHTGALGLSRISIPGLG